MVKCGQKEWMDENVWGRGCLMIKWSREIQNKKREKKIEQKEDKKEREKI